MVEVQGKFRTHLRIAAMSAMAVAGVCIGAASHAQSVDQTLDRFDVYGAATALGFEKSPTTPGGDAVLHTIGYTVANGPLLGMHSLQACQGTGTRGVFCLDKDSSTATPVYRILRWSNPDKVQTPATTINCADLGMSACSSMTVDLGGSIYVAGTKTGFTTYSLFKLVEKQPTAFCPTGWNTIPNTAGYCSIEIVSGRQRLYDLSMIDGESGNFFNYGPGVLALEATSSPRAVILRDAGAGGTVVLNDKWGLKNGELLQGATLLQIFTSTSTRNFIMVTTSFGRALGYEVPWAGNSSAFDTNLNLAALTPCAPASPYKLRTSARTKRTFFTGGTCVVAYDPVMGGKNQPPVSFPTLALDPGQTVSDYPQTTSFTLDVGVSVSPGIDIDFVRDGCTLSTGCTILNDGSDANAYQKARLAGIQLADYSIAGWVVFQVRNIPDCRYLKYLNQAPAICNQAGVIVAPGGTTDPSKQYENIAPLMPPEVTGAFPGGLPQMLLGPDYRGRANSGPTRSPYTFDALFGVPEPGLTYRRTFDVVFDIEDLLGSGATNRNDCGGGQLPANGTSPPEWNVLVNLSELAPTNGGPVGLPTREYVSVLLNKACVNPTYGAGGRGSAFIYGLELAPKMSPSNTLYWPDSSFALLMRSLTKDYNDFLYTYACQDLDTTSGLPPLSAAQCDRLKLEWGVAYDKATRCFDATDQPKTSAGYQNCGAFETQWRGYIETVAATQTAPLNGPDPYNRVGELQSRTDNVGYMYYFLFKTSIKPRGFLDPNH